MTQPAQPLFSFLQKSNTQIHDDVIRTLKNGLIGQGVANPNVGPNSDYDLIATAVGNEIAVVHANTVVMVDANMPDTAGGSNLDRWLAIFNRKRNGGIGSSGNISAPCSVSTPVAVQQFAQLTDSAGLRYQVTTGGLYTASNGVLTIPIQSIDVGSATNHQNGDTLQWVVAPAFCTTNVSVGAIGGTDALSGGADSEVGLDEPPRARLLSVFANPPKGGNAADIAAWAQASSTAVQACFVYPALLGPGTVFFLVVAAAQTVAPFSSTSKNRNVLAATVSGTVIPYVQGLAPTYVLVVGATATNVPADIAMLLNLPSAPTASPPGPGGGWLDGSPWPTSVGGSAPCTVQSVASSTTFTVNATTTPTPGVSHVAWLSPNNWQLYTATVLSVSGTAGSYTITLDTPMPGIATGNYIFPQAVNTQNYVNSALAAFGLMGPGEWTTSAAVLARAVRHPLSGLAWPNTFGASFLKQVINSGPEVLDANWIFRSAGSGPPTPPASITLDANNNLTSAPPGIYVPRNIGFYQQ